jgi:nickel/cobalt transporter (NicO) family protein
MTVWSTLLFGLGLGLRHATDADHLVVVSALVQRERSVQRAAQIAALWGIGHTATFLGLGLLIVLAELRLPPLFETGAEATVGAMLLGLGLWRILRVRDVTPPLSASSSAHGHARPLLIGVVHGLAGSAGIALLAATTISSRALAAMYLGVVALGTLVGMVVMTAIIARPIGWATRGNGAAQQAVTLLAALLSVALGIVALMSAFTA